MTDYTNHDDRSEENLLRSLTQDMTADQKERFKGLLQQGLGRFVREQADLARGLIMQDEQQALQAQYNQEASQIPPGQAGIRLRSNLDAKYQQMGLGSSMTAKERAAAAEEAIPTPEQEQKQAALWEKYQNEIAPIRGDIPKITKVQAKYRKLGLQV